ncbi:recombinase family protein [Paenibacillus alkalitolerans]|uniref:recombinase family protein n=1 Tax=Paenibacillus alkalitolerans TaxID=2799335 RepID=UPI0018F2F7FA|nr:recombinase family protein [Paenibacillus alkalitolerans]
MRVAIYTRVSTDRQSTDGFSLEAQHDRLLEFVRLQQWELIRVYTDPGVSAKNLDRPGVKELIEGITAGMFQAVIVHKLDRLTRNISDLYDLVELVNEKNVKLISLSENIDTSTPMGRMFIYILGIFAQMFRENLKEEVIKGMTKRAQKGLRNGSTAPFGYEYDDNGNLVIVEEDAEWVRQIFKWYTVDKWGFDRIARTLTLKEVPSSKGKSWYGDIVQYILGNITYIGKHSWNGIVENGSHPPIVDEVTFHKAQTQMKRRSLGEIPRSSRDAHPFSGIVRCGKCGNPYHGRILKHKYGDYYNYRCYARQRKGICTAPDISEMKLEKLLFEHMKLIEQNIEMGREEVAPAADTDIQKERKRIERDLSKSETRRKNWQYAFGDEKLPYEDYVKLIDEEMERVRMLQDELSNLPEVTNESPVSSQDVLEMFRNLRENWKYLESPTKREIVQSWYQRIVIENNNGKWAVKEMVTY